MGRAGLTRAERQPLRFLVEKRRWDESFWVYRDPGGRLWYRFAGKQYGPYDVEEQLDAYIEEQALAVASRRRRPQPSPS